MDSLAWVDKTYQKKHATDPSNTLRTGYYDNLSQWEIHTRAEKKKHPEPKKSASDFIARSVRKGAISVAIYAASFLPVVGRFVLPAASFYSLQHAAGVGPAGIVFFVGLFIRRRYIVMLLQSYFASRSLVRELVRKSRNKKKEYIA